MQMAFLRKRKSKKPVYYIRYTDENGKEKEVKGSTDKRIAQQMALSIELDVEKIKLGLNDVFSEHAKKSIQEHLNDFSNDLVSRNITFRRIL